MYQEGLSHLFSFISLTFSLSPPLRDPSICSDFADFSSCLPLFNQLLSFLTVEWLFLFCHRAMSHLADRMDFKDCITDLMLFSAIIMLNWWAYLNPGSFLLRCPFTLHPGNIWFSCRMHFISLQSLMLTSAFFNILHLYIVFSFIPTGLFTFCVLWHHKNWIQFVFFSQKLMQNRQMSLTVKPV